MFGTEANKYINYAFDYKEALYCQVPFHGKSGKALKCKAKKTCIFIILFYLQITVCVIIFVVTFTISFSSVTKAISLALQFGQQHMIYLQKSLLELQNSK